MFSANEEVEALDRSYDLLLTFIVSHSGCEVYVVEKCR
jgi:hypothetical protein